MSDRTRKERVVVIGSGGHASSVIDILMCSGEREIHGIVTIDLKTTETYQGFPVLGDDSILDSLITQKYSFVIAIGQIGSSSPRYKIYSQLIAADAELPTIVSPNAYISRNASLGRGNVVFHRVVINANAYIADNCILNSCCLIEHDAIIGYNTHISTGVIVNGGVNIGNDCFIGSSSVIANNITICNSVILGAGSVVVKDINEPGVYFGNPAKKNAK